MALLDGFPTTKEEAVGAFGAAKPVLDKLMDPSHYSPRLQSALEQAKAGLPTAALLNLSSRELDAVFNQACRALQYGERQKARESALMLTLLKPLEARYLYLLAATAAVVADRHFDLMFDSVCADAETRDFLLRENPAAAAAIADRFADALRRGLWTTRRNSIKPLLQALRGVS